MKFYQVVWLNHLLYWLLYIRFVNSVSAGSDKMSPAQVLKSAYDFSESAESRANLSAFSFPEPFSTCIFGKSRVHMMKKKAY